MSVRLFDCDASIGLRLGAALDEPSSASDLLAEMDRMGIERALVAHASGWESLPSLGNARIEEEARGHARLARAWIGLPDAGGGLPPAADWLGGLVASGARAVWLFPARMNWSLEDWCAGPLLSALEERRVPAFLPAGEAGWDQIHRVLDAHPRLALVLSGVSYRHNRMLFPLLDRHAGLRVSIAPRWDVHDGIEQVCARAGAGRLLFGTHWPECDLGATIAYLAYARISAEERAMIGSENLERMLAEVCA